MDNNIEQSIAEIDNDAELITFLKGDNVEMDDMSKVVIKPARFLEDVKTDLSLILRYLSRKDLLIENEYRVICDFSEETFNAVQKQLPFYEEHWHVFGVSFPEEPMDKNEELHLHVIKDAYNFAKERENEKIDEYVGKVGLHKIIEDAEKNEKS